MPIPEGFLFNQGKFQDYIDCQRRFQLRYLLERSWPALEAQPAEDYERLTLLGLKFHQIIRQYIIGIPESRIAETIHDETLRVMWQNFLKQTGNSGELNIIVQEHTQNHPEISISTPIMNYQMIAKFDLISVTRDRRIIIFDWKSSRKPPERGWLKNRMQTRIYPYIVAKTGKFLTPGNKINPDDIEMVYWFANYPDRIEKFKYSREQHTFNEDYLTRLIDEIDKKQDGEYSLTPNERTCSYCSYRSLCRRGEAAGAISDMSFDPEKDEDEFDIAADIEQIAEIEF